MRQYRINEIYSDGYERFAAIEEVGRNIKINVHFLEYDEYLENREKKKKKKKGDTLEGNLSIELVSFSRKANENLGHHQEIPKSPHIEAIIEVAQMIDSYSMYALSSISDDCLLIEFEHEVSYKAGERILVVGSLEFNETAKKG